MSFCGFSRPFAPKSFSFCPPFLLPLIEELAILLDFLCDFEYGFVPPALLQFALPHDDDVPSFRFQFPPYLLVPLAALLRRPAGLSPIARHGNTFFHRGEGLVFSSNGKLFGKVWQTCATRIEEWKEMRC